MRVWSIWFIVGHMADQRTKARKSVTEFMTLLRRHRIARGFTQTALAKKLGVDPSAVCFWESGAKMPRPELVPKIARIFGMTPMQLTLIIEPEDEPVASK